MTAKIATEQENTAKPNAAPCFGEVVDVFCGAGGLSHGFHINDFDVVGGIDVDEQCRFAYESNNSAPFIRKSVEDLTAEYVNSLYSGKRPRILVGCAPCQPFSTYNQKNDDPKWRLLGSFARLAVATKPDVISVENVPALARFRSGEALDELVETLSDADYYVDWEVLYGPDFGLAQTRSRLVLLASRLGVIKLPSPTKKQPYATVKEVIGDLPAIAAGEGTETDRLHVSSSLSERNLARIKQSKPGGTWRDWDDELVAACHKKPEGRGYSSVYGRMKWDEPSPTITTQFFGFGNGRFGHPEQDRALSLREGAMLQGFPENYQFTPPGSSANMKMIGRMIGNAVPVKLSEAIATTIRLHLQEHTDG